MPLKTVRSMLRIADRRRSAIRVRTRLADASPPSPAPSIAAQRVRHANALAPRDVCSVSARPVHGPRCPDVRGRMLRKRTHAEKRVRETVRGQRPARVMRLGVCERPKRNTPGGRSEGVRVPRRSGDRSPGRRSVVVRAVADGISVRPQPRACIAFEARWHVLAVEDVDGFHRKSAREIGLVSGKNAMCVAMGAHITRDFFGMQTFFSHPSP